MSVVAGMLSGGARDGRWYVGGSYAGGTWCRRRENSGLRSLWETVEDRHFSGTGASPAPLSWPGGWARKHGRALRSRVRARCRAQGMRVKEPDHGQPDGPRIACDQSIPTLDGGRVGFGVTEDLASRAPIGANVLHVLVQRYRLKRASCSCTIVAVAMVYNRMICFPKLAPARRSMRAHGAMSRPSTMSSRYIRRPEATSGVTSRRKSSKYFARKSKFTNPRMVRLRARAAARIASSLTELPF